MIQDILEEICETKGQAQKLYNDLLRRTSFQEVVRDIAVEEWNFTGSFRDKMKKVVENELDRMYSY